MRTKLPAQQVGLKIRVCAASSPRLISSDTADSSFRAPVTAMHAFMFTVSCCGGRAEQCVLSRQKKKAFACLFMQRLSGSRPDV